MDDISNRLQNCVLSSMLPVLPSGGTKPSGIAREESAVNVLVVSALRIVRHLVVARGQFWRAATVFYLLFLYLMTHKLCAHTHT